MISVILADEDWEEKEYSSLQSSSSWKSWQSAFKNLTSYTIAIYNLRQKTQHQCDLQTKTEARPFRSHQ